MQVAIEMALNDAAYADQIGYVNAHGTSTDRVILRSLRRLSMPLARNLLAH